MGILTPGSSKEERISDPHERLLFAPSVVTERVDERHQDRSGPGVVSWGRRKSHLLTSKRRQDDAHLEELRL